MPLSGSLPARAPGDSLWTTADPAPSPTRILVVEDHPIFLKGLVGLLGFEPDFEVVAEATSRLQALEALALHGPEVALVDLSLGDESGLDLIKDILFRAPATRILVLSMHEEAVYAKRSLAAGALGFCHKGESVDQLVAAIRTVASGHTWTSARSVVQTREGPASTVTDLLQTLTDREFVVLGLVGKGLGTGEIATKLHISVKTVDTYKGNLKRKFGCANTQELRRIAVDWQASSGRL